MHYRSVGGIKALQHMDLERQAEAEMRVGFGQVSLARIGVIDLEREQSLLLRELHVVELQTSLSAYHMAAHGDQCQWIPTLISNGFPFFSQLAVQLTVAIISSDTLPFSSSSKSIKAQFAAG